MNRLPLFKLIKSFSTAARAHFLGSLQALCTRKLDVIVVSPGGVATTFFIKYLRNFKRVNDPDDIDRLKHTARPPFFTGNTKFIYLHGDPKSIILSLERRGYLQYQIQKNGTFLTKEIKNLNDYLSTNKDLLRLNKSLTAWKKAEALSKNILTVHFNDLWSKKHLWANFLELSEAQISSFPDQRPRATDNTKLSNAQLQSLHKIYPSV